MNKTQGKSFSIGRNLRHKSFEYSNRDASSFTIFILYKPKKQKHKWRILLGSSECRKQCGL